jgi:Skp family chaperone for outer membrane proteins
MSSQWDLQPEEMTTPFTLDELLASEPYDQYFPISQFTTDPLASVNMNPIAWDWPSNASSVPAQVDPTTEEQNSLKEEEQNLKQVVDDLQHRLNQLEEREERTAQELDIRIEQRVKEFDKK